MKDVLNMKMGKTYDFDFKKIQFQRINDHKLVPLKIGKIKILNQSFAIGSCLGLISLIFEIIFRQELRSNFMRIARKKLDKLFFMMRKVLNQIK